MGTDFEGFASGFLAKSTTRIGYGICFTTTRIIGMDLGKNGGGALSGAMAGFIDGQLVPRPPPKKSASVISDLGRMKDFELEKNEINRVKLQATPVRIWECRIHAA